MALTAHARACLCGDLTPAEIERRYQVALMDIRRGGTGEIARAPDRLEPRRLPVRSARVLAILGAGARTITAIAEVLGCSPATVWGHVSYLRKQDKVRVIHYLTNDRRRKIAVYGVVQP